MAEIIQWANKAGYTIRLTDEEQEALGKWLRSFSSILELGDNLLFEKWED